MDEYHNQNRNSDEQANNQPPSSDSLYPQSGQTDGSQQWQQPNNLPDNRQPWQGELQNNQSYWQNGPQNNQQPWQNRQQDNQSSWQNGPQNNQPYWQNGPQNNQSYWQNGPQDNQSYWQQQGGQQYWQQPPRQQNNLALASMIFGIFSLLTCCIPFFQFPLAIISIVLVILSKKKQPLTGFAIAGLIMGIISIFISILMVLYWGQVVSFMNSPEFMDTYNEMVRKRWIACT